MVVKRVLLFLSISFLSSCASKNLLDSGGIPNVVRQDTSLISLQSEELKNVREPIRKPVVAVYPGSFADHTGQRKSNSQFALFSTAISQRPEAYLIRALKHTGDGNFWRVVERVGLESLSTERQIIRSTRETFEEEQQVKPLVFAGLLLQGGVLSYDVLTRSGGFGSRALGVGSSKEYRVDTVTVSLRLVSVSTGEILIEASAQKDLLSVMISQDVFRFFQGTKLIEIEGGRAQNESTSMVLQSAIETCVLEIIRIGLEKGYWGFKDE